MSTKILFVTIILAAIIGGYYFTTKNSGSMTGSISTEKTAPGETMMEKEEGETGMMKKTTEQTTMMEDEGENMMEEKDADSKTKDATDAIGMNKAWYLDYSDGGYESLAAKKRVLFFFASWCPICIPADADIKANVSKLPTDVAVFKVHYNDPETTASDRELAKKYGVTYQHTFVQVDAQGNAVTKWNGGGHEDIIKNVQ